jgi:5-methylthioadenosine/S-adenosylhomocysteine deaminase
MTKVLIDHGWVIPMAAGGNRADEVIEDGAVAIDDDRIVAVGPRDQVLATEFAAERVIDATGRAVLPGLINTHFHFVGSLIKAITEDVAGFGGGAFSKGIPLQERHVGPEDVYYPGLVHGLEALKTGTTCVNEMWWLQPESAKVARDLGIRAVIGGVVRELDTGTITADNLDRAWDPALAEQGLEECQRLIEEWHGAEAGRITCRVAPDGPDRMQEATLLRAKELAERFGVGLHSHVASFAGEIAFMTERYGKGPIEFLHDLGMLGPDLVAAHCVCVSEAEIEIMAETGTRLAHTPYLVGKRGYFPPMEQIYQAGVQVSLGTDWVSNDMWKTMRAAIILSRVTSGQVTICSGPEALRMATIGGARCLGLEDEIGSLEAGKKADLVVLDVTTPWVSPIRAQNLVTNIVYNANGSDVTHVMVDGNLLVDDRAVTMLDEAEVLNEGQKVAEKVWHDARVLLGDAPA